MQRTMLTEVNVCVLTLCIFLFALFAIAIANFVGTHVTVNYVLTIHSVKI